MAALNFRRRQTRRWWYAGATLMAAAFFAVIFVVGAGATIGASDFQGNDGNLVTGGVGHDWDNAPNLSVGVDKPTGTQDNSFGQGTKEDNSNVTVVSGSIPNSKADLARFAVAGEVIGGDTYMYIAWSRENQSGTVNFDFELNQAVQPDLTTAGAKTLNRTTNDALINYAFSGGSNTPTLTKYHWNGSNWVSDGSIAGTCSEGATNSVTVSDTLGGNPPVARPAQQFGEAAINLTCAGIVQAGTCEPFASLYVKSRSSTSFTSEIKDFIAPVKLGFSNCGKLTIIKHTDPAGLDQDFSYSTTGGLSPSSFTLNDGTGKTNTQVYDTLQPGTYTVTEGADPSGFTFESLTCTGAGGSKSGRVATAVVTGGSDITCTYINQQNTASLSTSISPGPVTPGTAVHDTATVTGNQATKTPSGTVTFSLCGPTQSAAGCSSGGSSAGSGLLSGSGTTATASSSDVNTSGSPLAPGFYCFRASWPGDTSYPGTKTEYGGANGTNECFQVSKIPTGTVTAPSSTAVSFGASVTDNATITATQAGGGALTGQVDFYICNPLQTVLGACAAGTSAGSDTTLTDGGTTPPSATASSNSVTANMTGIWCFRAVYTPSGNSYLGSNDSTSDECFLVTDTTSASSTQSWIPNDSATVTSVHGAPLSGTLTVQLYTGTGCQAGNAVANHSYTQQASGSSSSVSLTTTNSDVFNSSVSWLVSFASSNPNVSNPTAHCESSTLTVNN